MIDFTLTKGQQQARDYAHKVAAEEMRPISLECDRSEKIPDNFFVNMQKRFWGGAAAQGRQQAQEDEERQNNVYSVLSQPGAMPHSPRPFPVPAWPPRPFYRRARQSSRRVSSARTLMGNCTGARWP